MLQTRGKSVCGLWDDPAQVVPPTLAGGGIDIPIGGDDAAVILGGPRGGNVTVYQVMLDQCERAIERIAKARTPGQLQLDDLVGARQCLELADAVILALAVLPVEQPPMRVTPRLAAKQPRRFHRDAFGINARQSRPVIIVQLAQPHDLAKTAAMATGAAAIGDVALFEHQQWRAGLEQFDRRVGRTRRPQQRGLAVMVRRGALAAALEEMVAVGSAVSVGAVAGDRYRQPGESLNPGRKSRRQSCENVGRQIPSSA